MSRKKKNTPVGNVLIGEHIHKNEWIKTRCKFDIISDEWSDDYLEKIGKNSHVFGYDLSVDLIMKIQKTGALFWYIHEVEGKYVADLLKIQNYELYRMKDK